MVLGALCQINIYYCYKSQYHNRSTCNMATDFPESISVREQRRARQKLAFLEPNLKSVILLLLLPCQFIRSKPKGPRGVD